MQYTFIYKYTPSCSDIACQSIVLILTQKGRIFTAVYYKHFKTNNNKNQIISSLWNLLTTLT